MRKVFYIVAGTISLLIALFIILTPFTPGSPVFLIFAALCFARVNPRVECWLQGLPWIGERMRRNDPEAAEAQEWLETFDEDLGAQVVHRTGGSDEPVVVDSIEDSDTP